MKPLLKLQAITLLNLGYLGLLIPEGEDSAAPPPDFHEKLLRWTMNGFNIRIVIQSTRNFYNGDGHILQQL